MGRHYRGFIRRHPAADFGCACCHHIHRHSSERLSATGEYVFVPNNDAINALVTTQSQTYTVTASNTSGTSTATLTVIINGVNDAPTIAAPTKIHVTSGTIHILTGISFSDVDAGADSVTVTLSVSSGILTATSGGGVTVGRPTSALSLTGTISNINTFIAGSNVVFYTTSDTEANVSFTIAINDNGGSYTGGAKSANTTVTMSVPPRVVNVTSSSANGIYKAGAQISILVKFSAPVTVTGTPQLLLETGATDRAADYASGSGTEDLVFDYTVQPYDSSANLDYVSTSSLMLNGGTITGNGVAVTLTLPAPGAAGSLGANQAIILDTVAPPTPTISISSDSGAITTDGVTSNLHQTITVFGEAGASVELDFGDGLPPATGTAWGSEGFSVLHTYAADGKYTISATLTDAAGNRSNVGTKVIVIDTYAPSITTSANKAISAGAATNGAIVCALTATDATSIAGFTDALSWTVSGGADADKFSIVDSDLIINSTGGLDLGSYIVQVTAEDTAGNRSTRTITVFVGLTVDAVTHSYSDTASIDTFAYASGNIVVTPSLELSVEYGIDGGTTAPAGSEFTYQSESYDLSKVGAYGTLYVKSSNGKYVYVPTSDALLNALRTTVTDNFTITATDSVVSGNNSLTVTINGVNDKPEISVADSVSVVEGTVEVFTASGSDPEGDTIIWHISGGADAEKFSINSGTGLVTFVTAPSFATPTDADTNNSYVLQITANDGALSTSKTITVIVTQAPPPVVTPSVPTPPRSTVVEVNGENYDAGQASTQTTAGTTTTTITIDESKLSTILEQVGVNATVTIPSNGTSDVVVGVLTGQTVKNMEQKEAVLEIKTDAVTYTLPASQINIDAISSQLGSHIDLKDITVSVQIAEPSADTVKVIEDAAGRGNYQLVVQPVEFTITCTSGDSTVEVSRFNTYVERMIAIPDGVDLSRITTGVVLNADGTFSHVPTSIVEINGKYFAKINSLSNSTYAVIYNPVTFTDVASHWAKDAVNDMGARMVVSGVGNGIYAPERNMTRAEFAAIIVRALGLTQGMAESVFDDVTPADWFNGYVDTAVSYSLITGYNSVSFGPDDTITREQAMTILARAMKLTGLSVSLTDSETSALFAVYADTGLVSNFAKAGVAACIKAGIVSGTTATTLSPKDSVTRAEVAVMVQRLLQSSGLI